MAAPLPTAPANRPGGLGGLPVQTPQQVQAAQAQQQRMQEQFKLRMSIAENLRQIKHTIIVMSGKGGVGKSTVAVNIAAAFAKEGWKVGLLDLDLTNPNAPHMLGVEEAKPGGSAEGIEPVRIGENLKLMSTEFFLRNRDQAVIWRGPIKMNMIHQMLGNVHWGELDLLVCDLPPGTSDEPLSIAQLLKDADGVVLVTTPQHVSVVDVKKSIQFVRTMDLKVLGVVENMSTFACPHCNHETQIFGSGGGAALEKEYGVPLLGQIPLEPQVLQAAERGAPYVWRDQETPTTKAFADVLTKLKARLTKEN